MNTGGRSADGLSYPTPVVDERARWAWTLGGAAGDSERHVVFDKELELSVMARALVLAPFVVVADDLSEVLCGLARFWWTPDKRR